MRQRAMCAAGRTGSDMLSMRCMGVACGAAAQQGALSYGGHPGIETTAGCFAASIDRGAMGVRPAVSKLRVQLMQQQAAKGHL